MYSWWFQPLWNILVELDESFSLLNLPRHWIGHDDEASQRLHKGNHFHMGSEMGILTYI